MTIEFLEKVFSEFEYSRCFEIEKNLKTNSAYNSYDKVFCFYNKKQMTSFLITVDNKEHKNQIAISIPALNYAVFNEIMEKIFKKLSSKMRNPKEMLNGNIFYLFENLLI